MSFFLLLIKYISQNNSIWLIRERSPHDNDEDRLFNDLLCLLAGATLGLQLDSVCGDLTLTMARGIEAVSLHRSNSVCRADFLKCDKSQNLSRTDIKPITALVGTELSSTSIPLASLLSLYYIPQVCIEFLTQPLTLGDLAGKPHFFVS